MSPADEICTVACLADDAPGTPVRGCVFRESDSLLDE
jgi:hypothetical protein